MASERYAVRREILEYVEGGGRVSTPFRKHQVNRILQALGGDGVHPWRLYSPGSPSVADLRQRIADRVGFEYGIDYPRSFTLDELHQVRNAFQEQALQDEPDDVEPVDHEVPEGHRPGNFQKGDS